MSLAKENDLYSLSQVSVNYIFFGFYLFFISTIHVYHVFLIEPQATFSNDGNGPLLHRRLLFDAHPYYRFPACSIYGYVVLVCAELYFRRKSPKFFGTALCEQCLFARMVVLRDFGLWHLVVRDLFIWLNGKVGASAPACDPLSYACCYAMHAMPISHQLGLLHA